MGRKVLFAEGGNVDGLISLHTEDKEGLGNEFEDEKGNIYRYVKNAAATALVAKGSCYKKLGGTKVNDILKRVLSADASTGSSSGLITMPAGVPMTGIGKSGSSTGCYGWVQVFGVQKVSVLHPATSATLKAGAFVPMTSTSARAWGTPTANLATYPYKLVLAKSITTTTAATASTALVFIQCR